MNKSESEFDLYANRRGLISKPIKECSVKGQKRADRLIYKLNKPICIAEIKEFKCSDYEMVEINCLLQVYAYQKKEFQIKNISKKSASTIFEESWILRDELMDRATKKIKSPNPIHMIKRKIAKANLQHKKTRHSLNLLHIPTITVIYCNHKYDPSEKDLINVIWDSSFQNKETSAVAILKSNSLNIVKNPYAKIEFTEDLIRKLS